MSTEEIYYCTACGMEDQIIFTRDLGFCNECGTPEHYELVETSEDFSTSESLVEEKEDNDNN